MNYYECPKLLSVHTKHLCYRKKIGVGYILHNMQISPYFLSNELINSYGFDMANGKVRREPKTQTSAFATTTFLLLKTTNVSRFSFFFTYCFLLLFALPRAYSNAYFCFFWCSSLCIVSILGLKSILFLYLA